MTPAIHIENIRFDYPEGAPLFSDFNLVVEKGDRFGLFGPNGAGKTTLMNLMTGLLEIKHGSIRLFGQEIKQNDKSINKLFGLVPQELSFYQELTPFQNLEYFGACSGLRRHEVQSRATTLLDVLDLKRVRDVAIEKLSGGMKRRVNLAIGVLHNPPLLFLDEPTVGVDIQTRIEIVAYLKQLNAGGTTLIYTSHQLNEAESLCNRIALINDAKIIANDDLTVLLQKHHSRDLEQLFIDLTSRATIHNS